MARRSDDPPRKRFSKSGHTSHGSNGETPPYRPASDRTRRAERTEQHTRQYPPSQYSQPQYPPSQYPQPQYPPSQYGQPPYPPPGYSPNSGPPYPPPGYGPPDAFGNPTYHHTPAEAYRDERQSSAAVAVTRAAFSQTNRAARLVTRKVISASKADGADESGLTALIWNQVLSYGTDAMITVALAGTVFFGASTDAQRGNILLYLLITMAPFAVVAPVIGPVLDRLQHGRRWTMAGTAAGRAILALIMAGHPSELLILYPCALGSLVLSKAYGVVRAAAAPRLVPPGMTLTEANARLSIFGLGSTLVLGGLVGVIIKVSGSYTAGLLVTAIGFIACAFFAARLPHQVDTAIADIDALDRVGTAPPLPAPARARTSQPGRQVRGRARGGRAKARPLIRLRNWARRGFDDHVVTALQGESVLRLLSGLLTIYLAFYVESTAHGLQAALELGGVVAAAGAGNFLGTAIGTKLKLSRPELLIVASTAIAAAVCLLVALIFGIGFAILAMLISAVANSLSKIALDALIQRDVAESLRSSAFARSETFLQLSWVVGAAIGVALPSSKADGGAIGFWVAAVVVGATAVLVGLRTRAANRTAARTA